MVCFIKYLYFGNYLFFKKILSLLVLIFYVFVFLWFRFIGVKRKKDFNLFVNDFLVRIIWNNKMFLFCYKIFSVFIG